MPNSPMTKECLKPTERSRKSRPGIAPLANRLGLGAWEFAILWSVVLGNWTFAVGVVLRRGGGYKAGLPALYAIACQV